jgi:hypothetical protein
VPPRLRPWTYTVPTEELVTFVNVTELVPSSAGSVETVASAPFALVTVTVIGLGGATPRDTDTAACKSTPTVVFAKLMFGAVTVAVICWKSLGVLKPVGVPKLTVELPAVLGWNAGPGAEFDCPPVMVVVGATRSPTLLSDVVKPMFNVNPPRTG